MDKEYWDNFYKKHNKPFDNSPFSTFIAEKYLKQSGESIIDLGCGNGRDSIFLSKIGMKVTAIDQSETIHDIIHKYDNNVNFINMTFEELDDDMKYDHAYSRFTLHSIPENVENHVLNWAKRNVQKYIFVEVRSDKDSLCGKKTDHYRRFLNFGKIVKKVIDIGFELVYAEQSRGFSKYKKEFGVDYNENDPVLIRLVLKNNI